MAALLLSLAVATACTEGGPDPSPGTETSAGTPGAAGRGHDEEATLRFGVYGPQPQVRAYVDLARTYERANPNVTVAVDAAPDAATAMAELSQDLVGRSGPDVFLAPRHEVPALIQADRVRPVNDLLEARRVDFGDGYQRDGLEAFSAEAALQCMPHDVSPLVVYVNEELVELDRVLDEPELLSAAEDGWTWEQFTVATRRAARGGVKGVHLEPSIGSLAPFLWSAGNEIVDDPESPTTLTLSSEENRETLEQILALLRDPQVTPTAAELRRRDAVTRFKDGSLAMLLGTRALTPSLRAEPGLDFDVMPLPHLGRYRTLASMTGYCVNADTEHLDAAADFLAYAVGRQGATITALPGYVVPANLQVQYSRAFLQPDEQPENTFVFSEGVRRTQLMPFIPEWPEVLRQTQPLVERMLSAPVIDLESLLQLIDARSRRFLPDEPPPEDGQTPDE